LRKRAQRCEKSVRRHDTPKNARKMAVNPAAQPWTYAQFTGITAPQSCELPDFATETSLG
jgi:hypothetical protein